MAVQVRESKHPYDNNTNFEVSRLLLPFKDAAVHEMSRVASDVYFTEHLMLNFTKTCAVTVFVLITRQLCHARLFCPQDKVHIPGAIYLSVKFDSRCYTEEGCDELIMSSSSDFVQDVHNFSGSPQKWSDFEIPGEDRLCVFAFEIM